jgi:hypothetical protein
MKRALPPNSPFLLVRDALVNPLSEASSDRTTGSQVRFVISSEDLVPIGVEQEPLLFLAAVLFLVGLCTGGPGAFVAVTTVHSASLPALYLRGCSRGHSLRLL